VLEAKRQGLPVSAPLFIPFLGALITLKQMPHNVWNEAKLAIAGPIVGSLGAAGFWAAGEVTDSHRLKALAFLGFFLNLFNLLPVVPLDGGRIVAALHPVLWLAGFLALLGLVFLSPNPILIIILIFSGMELWGRWRTRNHPELQEYYRATPQQRAITAALYFGLAVLLVIGMDATHLDRDRLR
jgi:Zn-dependent protease